AGKVSRSIYSRTPARDAQCPIQSAGARSRSTPRHLTILSAAGKDGLGPRDLAPLLRHDEWQREQKGAEEKDCETDAGRRVLDPTFVTLHAVRTISPRELR